MKKYKNLFFYVSIISTFAVLIAIVINIGETNLDSNPISKGNLSNDSAWFNFLYNMTENILAPVSTLLLQIVIILLAVRIFGWICQKIGQPTVIGEIFAGMVLGPSLLGTYFPEISDFIFPITSLDNIKFLSQIGLILFMFIVGLELDLKTIKNKAHDATIISHTSIIIPFSFGVMLAYILYGEYTYNNIPFLPFALFMGIAMSIAAFPVMARIVHERGINKTPLGPIIITCAAIDDITAWCLLATVIAIANAGSFSSSLFVILCAIIYIVIMFKIVRPFLRRIADLQVSKLTMNKSFVGTIFLVLFLSSYTTEIIGIHALFGAFLAGVIMPTNINFRNLFTAKIEDVSLVLLLPLFFVYTGLRTQMGLISGSNMWLMCLLIVVLAVVGKSFGSAFSAKFVGFNWKDSLTIGALMNTRGLMELVVLNIGLDLGILTPQVFAMMVVMALTTTFMTSPLLNLIEKIFKKKPSRELLLESKVYKILVSFDNAEMGKKLLYIANSFIRKKQTQSELTMLHIAEGNLLYQYNSDENEDEIFRPMIDEAKLLNQIIVPMYKIASDTNSNVVKVANKGEYDFLIIGHKGSILSGNVLGHFLTLPNTLINIPLNIALRFFAPKRWKRLITDSDIDKRTKNIVSNTDMPVGIFIDKGLEGIKDIFVPILDEEDIFVGEYMKRLAENSFVRITLWDPIGLIDNSIDFVKSVKAIESINPYLFQLWNNNIPIDSDILKKQNLVMISLNSWKKLSNRNVMWFKDMPSTLILTN